MGLARDEATLSITALENRIEIAQQLHRGKEVLLVPESQSFLRSITLCVDDSATIGVPLNEGGRDIKASETPDFLQKQGFVITRSRALEIAHVAPRRGNYPVQLLLWNSRHLFPVPPEVSGRCQTAGEVLPIVHAGRLLRLRLEVHIPTERTR